jgi:hypothetical protein
MDQMNLQHILGKVEFEYDWTLDKSGNRNLSVAIVNNTKLTQELLEFTIHIFDADDLMIEILLYSPDYEGNIRCFPSTACVEIEDCNYGT